MNWLKQLKQWWLPDDIVYEGELPIKRIPMADEFTFGKITSDTVYGTDDNQRYADNFDFLMKVAGPTAAYDYLFKHVDGGTALYRSAAQTAGKMSEDTAKIVYKYGRGAAKGRIEGNEYVIGGNPFTKEGGVRYKLPR